MRRAAGTAFCCFVPILSQCWSSPAKASCAESPRAQRCISLLRTLPFPWAASRWQDSTTGERCQSFEAGAPTSAEQALSDSR